MLATASIGAIWSSASPDFGSQGALDRFGQIEPKLFLACDGYYYAGKEIDIAGKLGEIVAGLPTLKATLIVPYVGRADRVAAALPGAHALDALLAGYAPRPLDLRAAALRPPALHPLFVGHDRRAEVHRALGRRHPAAAPQGAPAALWSRRLATGSSISRPAAG